MIDNDDATIDNDDATIDNDDATIDNDDATIDDDDPTIDDGDGATMPTPTLRAAPDNTPRRACAAMQDTTPRPQP